MQLTFINGTDLQKQACRSVAHGLLNLPFDQIPLSWTIEFVPNPGSGSHNEFASTEYSYGSQSATTEFASVLPDWPPPWEGVLFFNETIAHELAHALYAALPESARIAIAQMFGAKSDDLAELQPPGTPWEDRYIEAIAETFKDAFLPPAERRYYNRTNHKLAISRYPEFRDLWRTGMTEASASGTPYAGVNLDTFHVGKGSQLATVSVREEPGGPTLIQFPTPSTVGLLDASLADSGHPPGGLYSQYVAQSGTSDLLLPPGTHLGASINLPQGQDFFGPSGLLQPPNTELEAQEGFSGIFDYSTLPVQDYKSSSGRLGLVEVLLAFAYWNPETSEWIAFAYIEGYIMGFIDDSPADNYKSTWKIIKGTGSFGDQSESWPDPPVGVLTIDGNVPVGAPKIETCGGEMVKVRVFGSIWIESGKDSQEAEATIKANLPSMQITLPAKPCIGEPIVIPTPELDPLEMAAGLRQIDHRVVGTHLTTA